ncbi:MAG: hypothetical protein JO355_11465 [Planctomycetaceae bacterium]|nr:hypothetical protein [Planctomycetaceae bacterium]
MNGLRSRMSCCGAGTRRLSESQGAALLGDEPEVMRQVLDRAVDHLGDRAFAPVAHDSHPPPRPWRRGAQDAGRLPPAEVKEPEFFVDVTFVIRERGQHQVGLDPVGDGPFPPTARA